MGKKIICTNLVLMRLGGVKVVRSRGHPVSPRSWGWGFAILGLPRRAELPH